MKPLISIGQIIDHTWDHYKKNFGELFMVSAWLFVIAIINIVAYIFYPLLRIPGSTQALAGAESFGVILYMVNVLLLAPILGIWIYNMIVRMIDRQQLGKKTGFKKIAGVGWKMFFSNLLIRVLAGLAILAGLVVLVIPGVIFTVWFIFALYALLIDGKRGRAALKFSRELVRNRWWSVLWRLLVPKVVFLIVWFAIFYLGIILINVLVTGLLSVSVDLAVRMQTILSMILTIGLTVLFNPAFITADYILYTNLKLTKE